jgi:hypothetical protein
MRELVKTLKSETKKSWPIVLVVALIDFLKKLFEHRVLAAANDFIDAHSGPILDAVRPFLVWLVHTPFVLLMLTFCVILLHAYFSSRHKPQHTQAPTDSPPSAEQTTNMMQEANPHIEVNPQFHIYSSYEGPKAREPIQETNTREQVSKPPNHNIVFLGGHRYDPNKHGLLGGPRESDMIRIVLAEFRNKHIVGSTVGHVYDVRAGITYSDDNGTELLYVSPGEWLRHDAETVKLECGAEPESVVLAAYNYAEKRWETRKMVHTEQYWGDVFLDEPRPLPFSTITAEIALLEKDGSALEGGTVTFELKENGDFEIC